MANITITPTTERAAAVDTYAISLGTTAAALAQARYDDEADRLIENTYNSWWNGLDLDAKKAIYDANQ